MSRDLVRVGALAVLVLGSGSMLARSVDATAWGRDDRPPALRPPSGS